MKTFIAIVVLVLLGSLAGYFSGQNKADQTADKTDKAGVVTTDDTVGGGVNFTTSAKQDLSNQGLSAVPGSVFSVTDTEVLDLSHNNLSGALPAEVRQLSKLKILDLSDNNFTGVPAEVGQLSQLEVLDLSNNPITGLPYEIGNLKKLKVLNLRGTSYAEADLATIRQSLSGNVEILVD